MADTGAAWSWLVDQGPTVAVLGLSVWALATGRVRPGADYDRAMALAEAAQAANEAREAADRDILAAVDTDNANTEMTLALMRGLDEAARRS